MHELLAPIVDMPKEGFYVDEVRVAHEYPDVFLEDLPNLPPNCEIEFPD